MTAFNPVDPVHVLATVATVMPRGISVDLMGHEGVTHRTCFVAPDDLVPVPPVPTPVLFADINVGNRIRAVHVGGTVTEFTVTGTDTHAVYGLAASCVEGHWQFFRLTPPVPPEPEYEVGAVYQSPLGGIFRRFPDCWQDFDGTKHPHDYPVRPLVRLVPEEPK